MWSRRQFIKAMGATGAALITPFQRLGRAQASALADGPLPLEAEFYEGFVLLPEDAPLPSSVQIPKSGVPRVCGVGLEGHRATLDSTNKLFNTTDELAKEINFPVYTLGELPGGLRQSGASMLTHNNGEIYNVSVNFEIYNSQETIWETGVVLGALSHFPKPFPLWSSKSVEPDGPTVSFEKANFLPSPGVMVVTAQGFVFHWIKNDVLYSLVVGHTLSFTEVQNLVAALILIQHT